MTSNDHDGHDDEGCGDNEDLQRPNDGEEQLLLLMMMVREKMRNIRMI